MSEKSNINQIQIQWTGHVSKITINDEAKMAYRMEPSIRIEVEFNPNKNQE